MIIDANLKTLYRLVEINVRLENSPLRISHRLDDEDGNPLLLMLETKSASLFAFSIQPACCEILPTRHTHRSTPPTDSDTWRKLKEILKGDRISILEDDEMTSTGRGLTVHTEKEIVSIFRDLDVNNTAGSLSESPHRHRRPGPGDNNLLVYADILEKVLKGDESINAICLRFSDGRNRPIAHTTIFRNMYPIITLLSERQPLSHWLKALEKRNWMKYYQKGEQARAKMRGSEA